MTAHVFTFSDIVYDAELRWELGVRVEEELATHYDELNGITQDDYVEYILVLAIGLLVNCEHYPLTRLQNEFLEYVQCTGSRQLFKLLGSCAEAFIKRYPATDSNDYAIDRTQSGLFILTTNPQE